MAHGLLQCYAGLSHVHEFAVVRAVPVSARRTCPANHVFAPLGCDGCPGEALDQLGVPRGVTINMPWRLSGELLCMGKLRGERWSTDGDWGHTANLLKALTEMAEAQGADPAELRFWMRYSPAAKAAAASGSGSEVEPPAAQDAADPFPLYSGAPGYMDVGVLCGQHLVPLTPEQVPAHLAEKPDRSWIIGCCTPRASHASSQACTEHLQASHEMSVAVSSELRYAIIMGVPNRRCTSTCLDCRGGCSASASGWRRRTRSRSAW